MTTFKKAAKAAWAFASRPDLRPAELVIVRALAVAGGFTGVVQVIDKLAN